MIGHSQEGKAELPTLPLCPFLTLPPCHYQETRISEERFSVFQLTPGSKVKLQKVAIMPRGYGGKKKKGFAGRRRQELVAIESNVTESNNVTSDNNHAVNLIDDATLTDTGMQKMLQS